MQATLTTKPAAQAFTAIRGLDLESVKHRLMDAELGEGWPREYADSIELAYKNYLTMLVKHPQDAEDIVLSKDVDEFWHTHILQTLKYTDDCERIFGHYLHHNPHVGPRTPADLEKKAALTEKTRSLYVREFGDVRSGDAAWSGPAIRARGAAWSTTAINAENTAWSAAAIAPINAAWSAAAVRVENTAWSAAAITPANAAWSAAAIEPENAAWSAAAVQASATQVAEHAVA